MQPRWSSRAAARPLVVLAWLGAAACGSGGALDATTPSAPATSPSSSAPSEESAQGQGATESSPGDGWVTLVQEDFEHLDPMSPPWTPDPVPDDGPFADAGIFFRNRGVSPPAAFRISQTFGAGGWLTAESYTRDRTTSFDRLVSIVPDPAGPSNRVLRISSPAHTDATVIRSSAPLPSRYRISLRVGFAAFGDGLPGLNGYATGQETAEPWWPDSAVPQNGFYELAILDALPRPHNNTWIHHHRKVVFDSDNNVPPWMEIFDGQRWLQSGERPVMMFAVDGRGPDSAQSGKPFLAWSGGAWQRDEVRAVDSYLPDEWYSVSIERVDARFTMTISGRFRYGGVRTYQATIDAASSCVWHFNRTASEDASSCVDSSPYDGLGSEWPQWPPGATWPDYFMFGDPHENYYRGEAYYDDLKLEVPG